MLATRRTRITHPLDGERPATVTHWCETWRAMRETRVPALVELDVLAWIETLEDTVAAQRALLREMREAAQEAAE